jgi:hypothetical protein
MKLQYNDGGQSESSHRGERSTCSIRALAIVTDCPFDQAYDLIAHTGRKKDGGTTIGRLLSRVDAYRIAWHEFNEETYPHQLPELFPRGRYIIIVEEHAFALIDGVIHDTFQATDRVELVYEFYAPRDRINTLKRH